MRYIPQIYVADLLNDFNQMLKVFLPPAGSKKESFDIITSPMNFIEHSLYRRKRMMVNCSRNNTHSSTDIIINIMITFPFLANVILILVALWLFLNVHPDLPNCLKIVT